MNFTLSKEDNLGIFHLHEPRLDSTNSADVKSELLILSQEPIDVLIVDLGEVTFCDSSGLSALLLAERQMRERGGGLVLVDANGKVKNLIEIAKLMNIIPVFPSIALAKEALEER